MACGRWKLPSLLMNLTAPVRPSRSRLHDTHQPTSAHPSRPSLHATASGPDRLAAGRGWPDSFDWFWRGTGLRGCFLPAEVDALGDILLPGFIDLHVHGAMGHELM